MDPPMAMTMTMTMAMAMALAMAPQVVPCADLKKTKIIAKGTFV